MITKKSFLAPIILGLALPSIAFARSGCCSHHGGVCGCGCCDGSGLSATCAPYYPECSSRNTYVDPTAAPIIYIAPKLITPKPTPRPTVKPTPIPTYTPIPSPPLESDIATPADSPAYSSASPTSTQLPTSKISPTKAKTRLILWLKSFFFGK